jgi:hypothetical protein
MKKLKLLALSGVALLIMAPAFADDFGFSSFGDEAISTADSSSDDSSSFGSFDTGIFGGDSSSDDSSSLQITGSAGLTSRVYLEDNGSNDAGQTYYTPSLKLDLSYSDTNSDLTGSILLNDDTVNSYPVDIINEITYRAYVNDFVLEAGKTKIVWGRGDKIHVLDLINANDLTNFLIPDYIDRRIAEPEMDVTWNIPSDKNLSLQLVFTPGMTVDRLDTSGRWTPEAVASIKSSITTYATSKILSAYYGAYATAMASNDPLIKGAAIGIANAAELEAAKTYTDENYYYANTNTLEYAQYGARLTGTKGTVDWGTEYYLGHYKTPSVTVSASDISLDYDRLQVFGVDAETVKGAYSIRGELAYYLTEDFEGDDYSTHNNSIQWVAGFDRNLPWSNLNLNIQELGSYIINYDEVTSIYDIDNNNADCASNDKIIVKLSDSLKNESLKPSISVLYGIEGMDLVIMPEVSYIVKDGFEVKASANFVFSDDTKGEFKAYNNNSELQLNVEYNF